MNRSVRTDSIILRTRRVGEFHKGLTCLTPEHGILEVMAYGAGKGKSRLSGLVDPFSILKLYLYHEPVKDSYKLSDVEQLTVFQAIRKNLEKFYVASFWAEVILRTYSGGGDSMRIFPLLSESLRLLNSMENGKVVFVLIQFIWRFLGITGFQPEISQCTNCGRELDGPGNLFFSEAESGFLCGSCGASGNLVQIPRGALMYLKHTSGTNLEGALKVSLDSRAASALKRMLLSLVQGIVEYPLNTLKKGLI
jgi:DNA repair protein RecO (recombination protein O)